MLLSLPRFFTSFTYVKKVGNGLVANAPVEVGDCTMQVSVGHRLTLAECSGCRFRILVGGGRNLGAHRKAPLSLQLPHSFARVN